MASKVENPTLGVDVEKDKTDENVPLNDVPSESSIDNTKDLSAAKSDTDTEPSNHQLMEMLCSMKQDITETKEIKTELAAFRIETLENMTTL